MANDFSDLDQASPAAGDLVSAGDDAIRETRLKIKNWAIQDLGNTNAEHHATGPHRFPVGNGTPPGFAGLPAVGNSGRIAFDTTNGYMLRDDGSTWRIAHASQLWRTLVGGPVSPGSGSFATVLTLSNVVIHAGGIAFIFWSTVESRVGAPAAAQTSYRVLVDATSTDSRPTSVVGPLCPTGSSTFSMAHTSAFIGTFSAGTHTFALQASRGATDVVTLSELNIAVLVL